MVDSETKNNLFLMPWYVDSVKEVLEKGKTKKLVIGEINYNAIQKNEEIKKEYEALIKNYPKFFGNIAEVNPEIIMPGLKPCMMSHNIQTGNGEAGYISLRKAVKEIANADNYFTNGVILSDFNAPLSDLVKKFNENKSGIS